MNSLTHTSWLVALIVLATSIACQRKALPGGMETVDWIIRYTQGPCFGECPVYEVYIAREGTALLHSRANLRPPGWYAGHFREQEIRGFLAQFEQPGFWTPAADSLPLIADLPSLHLVWKDGRRQQEIRPSGRMDDGHARLFAMIGRIVERTEWRPTGLRPIPWSEATTALIVQLQPGVRPEVWLSEHLSLGLDLEKVLSRRTGHFLFRLTDASPFPNDVLQHVRADPEVVGAEWDRELRPRRE